MHFREHLLNHLPPQLWPFKCDICKARFTYLASWRKHTRNLHDPRRPVVCAECGCRFTSESRLLRHGKEGHPDTPIVCVLCNATFADMFGLDEHLQVCTGRMYRCKYCQQGFAANDDLLECHMMTHQVRIDMDQHKADIAQGIAEMSAKKPRRKQPLASAANISAEPRKIKLSQAQLDVLNKFGLTIEVADAITSGNPDGKAELEKADEDVHWKPTIDKVEGSYKSPRQSDPDEFEFDEGKGPVEATPQVLAALKALEQQFMAEPAEEDNLDPSDSE